MNREQCLKLIHLYGEYKLLWDAQCPNYTNRGLREDAWSNINREMNIPIMNFKKKMESLLGSYRRERSREKKSRITGSGRGDIYKSNWYAYEAFSFLSDRNHPGNTQDTLPEDNACQSEIQNDGSQSETRNDGSQSETQNSGSQSETQNQVGNENTVKETRNEYTRAKKRTKRTEPNDLTDNAISEALTLLQQCASDSTASENHDSYDVYGQYVANELREYDAFTLAHVKHAINKIIFEADMGAYQSYTGYYTQSYSGLNSSNYTSCPSSSSMPPQSPMPPNSPMPPQSPMPPNSPMPPQSPMPPNSPMPPQSPIPPNSPMPPQSPMPPNSPMPPQSPMPPNSPMPPTSPMPLPPPHPHC